MRKGYFVRPGKVFRDAVHGDIFVPEAFVQLIDTPEFQRLRRIHQLSTANFVFPTADHTRFSHCLGTFHVMNMLIDHFKPILEDMNLPITEIDQNIARAAALLHDIGHGPFSHAFEKALPKECWPKDHEKWTEEIILSPRTQINKVLVENFGHEFPTSVASLINKNKEIENNGFNNFSNLQPDLFFILSSLVSSQLDADRLDYLVRDSLFTGVTYGKIDLSRIISALTLTEYDGNFYVCIIEHYFQVIEDYLLARYQMHKEIYLHPFKCEMELLLNKIMFRAFNLYKEESSFKKLVPTPLNYLFDGDELVVQQFIELDEPYMHKVFVDWSRSDDYTLAFLCACFINRNKFTKLNVTNYTQYDINNFKLELQRILSNYGYPEVDFAQQYFWLEDQKDYSMYKTHKEKIWVLQDDGLVTDLFNTYKNQFDILLKSDCEIDQVYNSDPRFQRLTNRLFAELFTKQGVKKMAFINVALLAETFKTSTTELKTDVNNLINGFDPRNHIEIEKKYIVDNIDSFENILNLLGESESYTLDLANNVLQIDKYFDTEDLAFLKSNRTLRIRQKGDKYKITIKTLPTQNGTDLNQNVRFEHEFESQNDNIEDLRNTLQRYIPELNNDQTWKELHPVLVVENNRQKAMLTDRNVLFEIAFDDVTYRLDEKKAKDYQVEIELKSDYHHRVNLKLLSDHLEQNLDFLQPVKESKYYRGMKLLNGD